MNHDQALQLQAAEKYVLGELPQAQREEYEEHYFDCSECAQSVKALASFVDTAREVLRLDAEKSAARDWPAAAPSGWFRWLRPAVGVPVFATLLLLLGYQSFVSVPHWKNLAQHSTAPRVLPMFSLIAGNTRSSESLVFRVQPGEPFGLYVDLPVDSAYSTYLLRLENPAGHSTILSSVSFAEAQKTQVVAVNPGTRDGRYRLIILGLTQPGADPSTAAELARIQFSVEFGSQIQQH